jgi:hypothetical protein
MEKTAVEWLVQQLEIFATEEEMNIIAQAKEIEQQQIVEAAMWMPKPFSSIGFIPELAKQYYNNKYGDM